MADQKPAVKKYELTPAEREVHFNMMGDDHDTWEVACSDPYWLRRLLAKGHKPYKTNGEVSYFKLPANALSLRRSGGERSEKQKAHAQARGAALARARQVKEE